MLLTGMRRSELLGLEWPDIDFDDGIIHIRRTSQYAAGKGIFTDTTKTDQSQRSISVSAEILNLLRQYRAWQTEHRLKLGDAWSPDWSSHPRLFTKRTGEHFLFSFLSLKDISKGIFNFVKIDIAF